MTKEKIPVIAIIGPTAVGKTEFSLSLAKELNAEVISVDSRQVYRYLDVGDGQGLARGAPRNHPPPDRHCGPGRNLFRRGLRAGRGRRGAANHRARARASAHRRHALLLPRALGRALGGPAEGRGSARAARRGDRGARPRCASRRAFGNRPGGGRADTTRTTPCARCARSRFSG